MKLHKVGHYPTTNTGTAAKFAGLWQISCNQVIASDEPILKFTMAISDAEAPYGFQVVDAVVDGSRTSDALFDHVD